MSALDSNYLDWKFSYFFKFCAIRRKVAGSIPDEDTGFFNWPNPYSRTMALGVDSASNRNEYQEPS
jgi:hypothetical protein